MLTESASAGKIGAADFASFVEAIKAAVSETLVHPVLLTLAGTGCDRGGVDADPAAVG